jgi:peroxiredoxin
LKIKKPFSFALTFFLTLLLFYGFFAASHSIQKTPSHFPNVIFKNALSTKEQVYLGIQGKNTFTLNDIKRPFLLVELTNTYCVSCKKNIKIFNDIYKKTSSDKQLNKKIAVIGIAIGNNEREVEYFKKEHAILYPIVIDPEFTVHKALGEPRVPFTMFMRKDAQEKELIFKVHTGVFESADKLLDELKVICSQNY